MIMVFFFTLLSRLSHILSNTHTHVHTHTKTTLVVSWDPPPQHSWGWGSRPAAGFSSKQNSLPDEHSLTAGKRGPGRGKLPALPQTQESPAPTQGLFKAERHAWATQRESGSLRRKEIKLRPIQGCNCLGNLACRELVSVRHKTPLEIFRPRNDWI